MPRRTRPWVIEPKWYLRSIAYSEYLQTGHWRQRRESFKQKRRNLELERVCDLCGPWYEMGDLNDEIPKWHIHHVTYANLGAELDDDLAYLCGPCHHFIHFPQAQQSQEWASMRDFISNPDTFMPTWQVVVEDDGIPF